MGASRRVKDQLTIAYIADAGKPGTLQTQTANLIAGWDCDALIAAGDNSGYDSHTVEECWAVFRALGIPLYPVWGNHDYLYTDPIPGEPDLGVFNTAGTLLFPEVPATWGHKRYYHMPLGNGLLRLFAWHSGRDTYWNDLEPDGRLEGGLQYDRFASVLAQAMDWWKIAVHHHPPVTSIDGAGHPVELQMSPATLRAGYDLVLCGHTHCNEQLVIGQTTLLNVSSCTQTLRPSTGDLVGDGAGVWLKWVDDTHHCATKLIITPWALVWEIYDVETGALLYTDGIGSRRAQLPDVQPALDLGERGERSVPFRDILWSVAKRGGMIPEEDGLTTSTAFQITEGANAAAKLAWEFTDWPELVQFQELTVIDKLIPWRQQTIYGWQEVGVVLGIYEDEARCRPLCWNITSAGIRITSPLPDGDKIWLHWRPLPAVYTSVEWDSSKVYQRGQRVYDPVTGECYRAWMLCPEGTPVTDTNFWDLIPVPYCLSEPIKAGAEALFLRSEGQYGTAQILEMAMISLLEHELIQIHNQMGKVKSYRRR